jgi:tetratricopeptide (TPR) repeat protein
LEIAEQPWPLSNLSIFLLDTGALREAHGVARRALILYRCALYVEGQKTSRNTYWEGLCLQHLGSALCLSGNYSLSYLALRRSKLLFNTIGLPENESVTTSFLSERSLQLGDNAKAAVWAEMASQLATVRPVETSIIQATLRQGQAALGRRDFVQAEHYLHRAITRSRSVNDVGFELRAMISIAELEFKQGNWASAGEHLHELLETAELGFYYFCQCDVHNLWADIALAENDKPAAIDAATNAYRAAWCDGPPYAYHWGLVKAKAHLTALGAPEPDMPPFDASKFEPMPEVEINPKDEYWVDPDKLE